MALKAETDKPMSYEDIMLYVWEQLETQTDKTKRATLLHLATIAKSQNLQFYWSDERGRPYYVRKRAK